MDNIIFRTKNLSFQNAIHYQDIQILKDKVNFIIGKSGSGKSTLLRLLNGTLTSSTGEIWYLDKKVSELDTIELRKDVSLISQSVYLFDENIRDNFRLFYEYRGMAAPSNEVMQEFLQLCHITFPLDKDCTTMSGGEKQRVYIAIFLSFLPKVIMLDEPTSALDKENSYQVIRNILEACKRQGITVIIVSHDTHLMEAFADHLIHIGKED